MTNTQFLPQTQFDMPALRQRVTARLRQLTGWMEEFRNPSTELMALLMDYWYHQHTGLFLTMVHAYAQTAEHDADLFYGESRSFCHNHTWGIERKLREFEELPIGKGQDKVCSWEDFVLFFLDDVSKQWLGDLLAAHDRQVTPSP